MLTYSSLYRRTENNDYEKSLTSTFFSEKQGAVTSYSIIDKSHSYTDEGLPVCYIKINANVIKYETDADYNYKAIIDGKEFKGNEGKNTQLTLGKDLFLKGFDKQLNGVKKNDEKVVEAILPENFPEKELVNKKAIFNCKILGKLVSSTINENFVFVFSIFWSS